MSDPNIDLWVIDVVPFEDQYLVLLSIKWRDVDFTIEIRNDVNENMIYIWPLQNESSRVMILQFDVNSGFEIYAESTNQVYCTCTR